MPKSGGGDNAYTFLRGSDVMGSAKNLIERSEQIQIAIAYWGRGASERLDLEVLARKKAIVVCDLVSGACCPDEISTIQNALGKPRVLKKNSFMQKSGSRKRAPSSDRPMHRRTD